MVSLVVKIKFGKTSKTYENDCLQNFLLLFMSILEVPNVKNSHIWARVYFVFLKDNLKQT